MGLRFRKRIPIVKRHLWLNVSRSSRGWTWSISLKAFGITWNPQRKRASADLPGPFYYEERY